MGSPINDTKVSSAINFFLEVSLLVRCNTALSGFCFVFFFFFKVFGLLDCIANMHSYIAGIWLFTLSRPMDSVENNLSDIIEYFLKITCVYLSCCGRHACLSMSLVVRGQLVEVGSLLPLLGSYGSNLGH